MGTILALEGLDKETPLLTIIFVIAEDYLSRLIYYSTGLRNIKEISATKNMNCLTPLFFDDDIILFSRGNKRTVGTIKISLLTMRRFMVNKLAGGNMSSISRRYIIFLLVLRKDIFTSPIWGSLFFWENQKHCTSRVSFLMSEQLTNWTSSTLSMDVYIFLSNFIIIYEMVYTFMIYKWPLSLIKSLDVMIQNFVWSGDIDQSSWVTAA